MSEFVGDARLSDAEARSVIAHYPSFLALCRKGEDSLEAKIQASYGERGK